MAIIFCEFCGDYDIGATTDKIFLWREKAGFCGGGGNYYTSGNSDDIADNFVLLRYGVVDFGGGEFANFADFAICDGASVFDWCGGWCTFGGDSGGVYGDKNIRLSYYGGGIFWRDEKFFDRNRAVSGVGVWDLFGDICAARDWTYWAKNGKIKGRKLSIILMIRRKYVWT